MNKRTFYLINLKTKERMSSAKMTIEQAWQANRYLRYAGFTSQYVISKDVFKYDVRHTINFQTKQFLPENLKRFPYDALTLIGVEFSPVYPDGCVKYMLTSYDTLELLTALSAVIEYVQWGK